MIRAENVGDPTGAFTRPGRILTQAAFGRQYEVLVPVAPWTRVVRAIGFLLIGVGLLALAGVVVGRATVLEFTQGQVRTWAGLAALSVLGGGTLVILMVLMPLELPSRER